MDAFISYFHLESITRTMSGNNLFYAAWLTQFFFPLYLYTCVIIRRIKVGLFATEVRRKGLTYGSQQGQTG